MQARLIQRAKELLESGEVERVLGWTAGEFFYDLTPAVFTTVEVLEKDFRYNVFAEIGRAHV